MAYLKKIVEQLETEFNIHVHGNIKEEERIESVQFLTFSENDTLLPEPTTLYIGDYQNYCNVSLDCPILLFNCKYDNVNENVLHIYQPLDPMKVFNCIQKEILHSHQANLKKEEMFDVLQAGYGIQSIINTARTILHNPITICNTSFSIIAVSPKENSDDIFETYNNKLYLKKDALQNMRNTGIMTQILNTRTPFITNFDDTPNTNFLFSSIRIKRATVGYVCIRSTVRSFTDDDLSFVMDLSKILSIEMQKDDFSSQKSGLTYEYFLTDLIECNLDSIDFAKQRLIDLGQPFYKYFWVFTFSFRGESTNHLNPNYYIDQLLGIFRNGMSFYYKRSLVLLLTSKQATPFADLDIKIFNNFLQLNQMQAAVSFRYENILNTHMYYKQAMFLLKDKKCLPHEQTYFYDDNYLYHILGQCQSLISLKSLIHPDINFLMDYDKTNHTDYAHTLKCYFINERNALRTANYLHIHKSTFFYRWGKIAELIELGNDNCKSLFAYEFSFAIIDYIKTK